MDREPKYRRLALILEEILGSSNVYYTAPPKTKDLEYPCIIFQLSTSDTSFGDNIPWFCMDRFSIQFISKNPVEDEIHYKLLHLPRCTFSRFFTADNLNHWNYDIYFK